MTVWGTLFVAAHTITANICLDMIQWFVLAQSDGIEQADKGKMLFQQGGAPYHFNHKVWKALNVRFPERWNGKVNQHHVPNKVHNLSLLELFVGIYKKFSFMEKIWDLYHLQDRINHVCHSHYRKNKHGKKQSTV